MSASGRTALHPAFAALLLAAAAPVPAQSRATANLVLDLAYDKCPVFIDGKLVLETDPVLTAQGFGMAVRRSQHPVAGPVAFRQRDNAESLMVFGGAAGRLCQLNIIGDTSADLIAEIRGGLARLPYKLEPDPTRSGRQANGAEVETLRAVVSDREYIFVQFIHATVHDKPMAVFQLTDMRL